MRPRNGDLSPHALALRPSIILPLGPAYRRANDAVKPLWDWMPWALAAKRVFDVTLTLVLLLTLAPLFLVLMVWIPLDSPGNPFYGHERRGLHGRLFRIYKFRTMRSDAHLHRIRMIGEKEDTRLFFKHKSDPRVTTLGRFLRKYSLDELPQLFNVLLGDMSLVGPRPLIKEDFEGPGRPGLLYRRWVRHRHRLWPGISGLWQVSGRNELSFEQSMRLDLKYVTHWTPMMDLAILLRTIPVVLKGHGAY